MKICILGLKITNTNEGVIEHKYEDDFCCIKIILCNPKHLLENVQGCRFNQIIIDSSVTKQDLSDEVLNYIILPMINQIYFYVENDELREKCKNVLIRSNHGI